MKKLVLCMLFLPLFLLSTSTVFGQAYTATKLDIPYLNGGGSGMWINASGQVAGSFSTRHKGTVTCCHAFLWSKSAGMVDLGSLGGGGSSAYALNDSGEVTGWSATGEPGAVTSIDVFVWTQAGGMQDLSLLSACCFGQAGLNNDGQLAGTYNVTGGQHAFLWSQSTGVKDLGTLGGNSSFATAINGSSQVVGYSMTGSSPIYYLAFLWTETGGMKPFLDSSFNSFASGINASGEIVGTFSTDDVNENAFFWSQTGGMQDLGPAGSCCGGNSPAINGKGQVVGMRQTSDLEVVPFVWTQAAGMQDLSTLVRQNIKLTSVGSINDAGQIVASSFAAAFLLTPKMSVTIASSVNPSLVGQDVTITATMSSVAGPPPDGENVTFTSGTTVLAAVPMVNGVAAFYTSTLKSGPHSILARYAGDATYASCRSAFLKQIVTK